MLVLLRITARMTFLLIIALCRCVYFAVEQPRSSIMQQFQNLKGFRSALWGLLRIQWQSVNLPRAQREASTVSMLPSSGAYLSHRHFVGLQLLEFLWAWHLRRVLDWVTWRPMEASLQNQRCCLDWRTNLKLKWLVMNDALFVCVYIVEMRYSYMIVFETQCLLKMDRDCNCD